VEKTKTGSVTLELTQRQGSSELPFVQQLHQFDTGNNTWRIEVWFEAQHRLHTHFDSAMVQLHNFVRYAQQRILIGLPRR
jgi:hypothetical protein